MWTSTIHKDIFLSVISAKISVATLPLHPWLSIVLLRVSLSHPFSLSLSLFPQFHYEQEISVAFQSQIKCVLPLNRFVWNFLFFSVNACSFPLFYPSLLFRLSPLLHLPNSSTFKKRKPLKIPFALTDSDLYVSWCVCFFLFWFGKSFAEVHLSIFLSSLFSASLSCPNCAVYVLYVLDKREHGWFMYYLFLPRKVYFCVDSYENPCQFLVFFLTGAWIRWLETSLMLMLICSVFLLAKSIFRWNHLIVKMFGTCQCNVE